MKVGFQHPDNGIPCIAEWDEEGQTLTFDIENVHDLQGTYNREDIDAVYKWCRDNAINCHSIARANDHFNFLGISKRLGH